MKTNNKIQMFAVAAVALAAVACTDTWDEHYGNEGRPVSDKSLLQVMEEQGIWVIFSRCFAPRMCLAIISLQK